MKARRLFLYAGWLAVTALLYFFENNTGTRIVLAGTLLLPLLSGLRRLLPASGRTSGRGRGRFFSAFDAENLPLRGGGRPE